MEIAGVTLVPPGLAFAATAGRSERPHRVPAFYLTSYGSRASGGILRLGRVGRRRPR
jgi:hypothetical protein